MIDFSTKINPLRNYNKKTKKPYTHLELANESKVFQVENLEVQLESDRGRIIGSAALRRLQQKTQVFPLERNAAVRSRLTHSLEVQQNGRYIVKTIFKNLSKELKDDYKLVGLDKAIESIVEMSCLIHDIGNPPFGHFGEGALIDWFNKNTNKIFSNCFGDTEVDKVLKHKIITDLKSFEGNAQAIRLIYSLQRMNLTFVQSACILKYTRPAWVEKEKSKQSYLTKKAGFYLSEKEFVKSIQIALEIKKECRHPLTYIMEAADDISYCFADIEDAVDKGILSVESLKKHIFNIFTNDKEIQGNIEDKVFDSMDLKYKRSLKDIVDYAFQRFINEEINKNHEFFVWLKVNLIHNLIRHAAQRFIDNIEKIYNGTFNNALMEDKSPCHKVVKTLKEVGYKHVFNDKEVHTMEIKGFQIITGLLNHYKCLLEITSEEFDKIVNHKKSDYILESRLIDRIGNKYIKSYQKALEEKEENDKQNLPLWEFYYRNRMIQDHISGMNDQYALDEYRLLNVT